MVGGMVGGDGASRAVPLYLEGMERAPTGVRASSANGEGKPGGPILFFDGTCVLCDGFADQVLRRDRRRRFRLATLQGETAARLGISEREASSSLPDAKPSPSPDLFKTLILLENGRTYRKSDAVLRVLPHLGGIYRFAPLGRAVPRALRDAVYDLIARNRLRWFGARAACRMPTAAERDRFLP